MVQGNLNAVRYQQTIVQPVIVPHVAANRGMSVAQNNGPCHAARVTL